MVFFDIDVKKVDWIPKHVEDIAQFASRALETPLSFEELSVVGTDHIETIRIRKDEDIPKFAAIKAKTRFDEKVLRFAIPEGAIPEDFQPKKVKILAEGPQVAKYFGECQVSTRQVEFTLKLFECGHFYLKQTLPGAGASPYWVIFEGRWQRTEKGLSLEYLLRYNWQLSKAKPMEDFALEAVPARHVSRLAWCGDMPEQQLNGNMPAIVGEDAWCWVEICREPDKVEKTKARFNEEPSDDTPLPPVSAPEPARDLPRRRGSSSAERLESSTSAAPVGDAKTAEEESVWPMLVGLALFLFLFLSFSLRWWEGRGPSSVTSGF